MAHFSLNFTINYETPPHTHTHTPYHMEKLASVLYIEKGEQKLGTSLSKNLNFLASSFSHTAKVGIWLHIKAFYNLFAHPLCLPGLRANSSNSKDMLCFWKILWVLYIFVPQTWPAGISAHGFCCHNSLLFLFGLGSPGRHFLWWFRGLSFLLFLQILEAPMPLLWVCWRRKLGRRTTWSGHLFKWGHIQLGWGRWHSNCGRDFLCDGEDGAEDEGRDTTTGPCWSFVPGDVGTFLKWVNLLGVRVNELVIRIRAELFFGEGGMEAEGCCLNSSVCFFAFSNLSNSIFLNFSYPRSKCLYLLCNFLWSLTFGNGTVSTFALRGFRGLSLAAWGFPFALPMTCHFCFSYTFFLAGNVGSRRDLTWVFDD